MTCDIELSCLRLLPCNRQGPGLRAAEDLEQSAPIEDALHASEAFLRALRAGVGPLAPATPLPPRTPSRRRRLSNALRSATSEYAAVAAAAAAVAAFAVAEEEASDPTSLCPPGWLVSSVQGCESTDIPKAGHSRQPFTSLSTSSEPVPRPNESSPGVAMRAMLNISSVIPSVSSECSSRASAGSLTPHAQPVSAVMTFAPPAGGRPRLISQSQGGLLGIWMGGLGLRRSFSDPEAAESRVVGRCLPQECTITGGGGNKSYCLVLESDFNQCQTEIPIYLNMSQVAI